VRTRMHAGPMTVVLQLVRQKLLQGGTPPLRARDRTAYRAVAVRNGSARVLARQGVGRVRASSGERRSSYHEQCEQAEARQDELGTKYVSHDTSPLGGKVSSTPEPRAVNVTSVANKNVDCCGYASAPDGTEKHAFGAHARRRWWLRSAMCAASGQGPSELNETATFEPRLTARVATKSRLRSNTHPSGAAARHTAAGPCAGELRQLVGWPGVRGHRHGRLAVAHQDSSQALLHHAHRA
jgi:hypothetical protein